MVKVRGRWGPASVSPLPGLSQVMGGPHSHPVKSGKEKWVGFQFNRPKYLRFPADTREPGFPSSALGVDCRDGAQSASV